MRTTAVAEQVEALRSGRAFVDLSAWRKVRVAGSEAEGWLNDLLSAELSGLRAGQARRSLLLSPTGRIRADLTVGATGRDGILLVQDPIQPESINRVLEPYVLSSDVDLDDVTERLALIAIPGAAKAPAVDGIEPLRPSSLGTGVDLVAPAQRGAEVREALGRSGLLQAEGDAVEAWRIERGVGRVGVDLGEASLPQEAGLDERTVDYRKGCFLGQEAMARIRNLGHPTYLVLAAGGEGPVRAGEPVVVGGEAVGIVTSATDLGDGRTAAIVRIRWAARDRKLRTAAGAALRATGPASAPA